MDCNASTIPVIKADPDVAGPGVSLPKRHCELCKLMVGVGRDCIYPQRSYDHFGDVTRLRIKDSATRRYERS